MIIREAAPDLLDALLVLENEAFTCPWSAASFRDAFESPNITIYAAQTEDGLLCGFACLLLIDYEAEVLNIAVANAFRRQGIGDILLGHMLNIAAEKGVSDVFLEVRASNAPAQGLYFKHGFEALGIRKKYYVNPTEDAIVMRKTLSE